MSSKVRAEKEAQPSLITSLPEDITVDILARVPRCNYPTLSLVSKHFRSLVTSPHIYARRSLLGCTEHSLYVSLFKRDTCDYQLYILRRKSNGNHSLFHIPSLPPMPHNGSFVAVGSKIYMFHNLTSTASSIDCISHTVQPLPSMPVIMDSTVANIIDGRIYVIGWMDSKIVVFNTESQTWEPEMIKIDTEFDMGPRECVVMADKLYINYYNNRFVYEPKGSKWETDEMVNAKNWDDACVVDDVLYYYDNVENKLRAYDSEKKSWGVVNGVEEYLAKKRVSGWWETVSYGGKLFLFHSEESYIEVTFFAEISLERNQQREIWGKVEWCDEVVIGESVYIKKSVAVMQELCKFDAERWQKMGGAEGNSD